MQPDSTCYGAEGSRDFRGLDHPPIYGSCDFRGPEHARSRSRKGGPAQSLGILAQSLGLLPNRCDFWPNHWDFCPIAGTSGQSMGLLLCKRRRTRGTNSLVRTLYCQVPRLLAFKALDGASFATELPPGSRFRIFKARRKATRLLHMLLAAASSFASLSAPSGKGSSGKTDGSFRLPGQLLNLLSRGRHP